MDIKNSKEKYALTAGIGNLSLDAVEESVAFLLGGHVDYEFRTTVTAKLHTPQDIGAIAQWIKGAKRYYLQNFTDSGDLISGGHSAVPEDVLTEMCGAAETFGICARRRE